MATQAWLLLSGAGNGCDAIIDTEEDDRIVYDDINQRSGSIIEDLMNEVESLRSEIEKLRSESLCKYVV